MEDEERKGEKVPRNKTEHEEATQLRKQHQ